MISEIQGDRAKSRFVGKEVTVEATVTALFLGKEKLNGFYIQEEPDDHDNNPLTSEGLFIYLGLNRPHIEINDQVRITGNIKEFHGRTELSRPQRIVRCEKNSTPLQPLKIDNSQTDNKTINKALTAPIHWESLEGMLVTFTHPLTLISSEQLNNYGTLTLSPFGRLMQVTQHHSPTPKARAIEKSLLSQLIDFDDGSTQKLKKRVQNGSKNSLHPFIRFTPNSNSQQPSRGSQLTNVIGTVDYAFGRYRIQPRESAKWHSNPSDQVRVKSKKENHLRVATFNTHNFFNGHVQSRRFVSRRGPKNWQDYLHHRRQLVETLKELDADIYALTEVENDGYGQQSSVADITTALSQASNRPFAFAKHRSSHLGRDEIRSVILFNPNKLTPVGPAQTITTAPFDRLNRPPLLQSFTSKQGTLHLVVNHFKSKGGCPKKTTASKQQTQLDRQNRDQKNGEGCWSKVRYQAVNALLQWLNRVGLDPNRDAIILLGDLNAYYFESPLVLLEREGFENTVPEQLAAQTYSYNFKQFSGQLDHIFFSHALFRAVRNRTVNNHLSITPQAFAWNQFSDRRSQTHWKGKQQSAPLFDHDPIYIDILY